MEKRSGDVSMSGVPRLLLREKHTNKKTVKKKKRKKKEKLELLPMK